MLLLALRAALGRHGWRLWTFDAMGKVKRMTGKECFETDFTPSGIADRKTYRTWEELPLPLKRWWNDRAQLPEFGGPIDWNDIKRAVAPEG